MQVEDWLIRPPFCTPPSGTLWLTVISLGPTNANSECKGNRHF